MRKFSYLSKMLDDFIAIISLLLMVFTELIITYIIFCYFPNELENVLGNVLLN